MASQLSDFSPTSRALVYRCVELEVLVEAQKRVSAPPEAPAAYQEIFRLPNRLIGEVVDFHRQYANTCAAKIKAFPGMAVPDPWEPAAEQKLLGATTKLLHHIKMFVERHWPQQHPLVPVVVCRAADELCQRIHKEFEAGREAYWSVTNVATDCPVDVDRERGGTAKKSRKPRGKTAAELLADGWRDPTGQRRFLDAGSARAIGELIGKSESAVKEAGPIWTKKIRPALKGRRVYTAVMRSEEEDRLNG